MKRPIFANPSFFFMSVVIIMMLIVFAFTSTATMTKANASSFSLDNIQTEKVRVGDIDIAHKIFGKGEPLS